MDVIKKIIAQQIDEIPSVNKDTLILSLMNMRGSNFISFVSHTQPKMKKTGNIYANKIVKISNVSANVGFDYESGVNRRREKEGKETDFQSKSNWHEPVINNGSITALSRHCKTGELYLRCMFSSLIACMLILRTVKLWKKKRQIHFYKKPTINLHKD